MKQISIKILITLLTFIIGIGGWLYYQESQKIQILLPNARWEPIFFNGVGEGKSGINRATELAGLKELRKTSLKPGDIEIRFWRGFGLAPLEAVILKRNSGQWSAQHLKTDNYYDYEKVELRQLNEPKSGWESFWKQIVDKEILTLEQSSENECYISTTDGTGYVVEINQDRIYRTYIYSVGGKCREAKLMEEVEEILGLEFDSGIEQCKTTEWFACATYRKTLNQTNR